MVRTTNLEKDRRYGDVWMASWDGTRSIQLTHTADASESEPRFSPDGRYLSFLATRSSGDDDDKEKEKAQVWLLDRSGGEARKLTDLPGGVSDYTWSPDSAKLAIIGSDPDPEETKNEDEKKGKAKTPKPIVIDRYQFKRDGDRLSPKTPGAPLCIRRRDGEVGASDSRRLRRVSPIVVPRRETHRVLVEARRRSGSAREHGPLRHRGARGSDAETGHAVRRPRQRLRKSRGVQPRREAHRLPAGLVGNVHLLRYAQARRGSGLGR